jgi:hypothetical protein
MAMNTTIIAGVCFSESRHPRLPSGDRILNHFHPVKRFLTYCHHPSRATKCGCSWGMVIFGASTIFSCTFHESAK